MGDLKDPRQREIIFVIDDYLEAELRYNDNINLRFPQNRGIAVISISRLHELEHNNPELARIIKNLSTPGDILVRNPFESYDYVHLEKSDFEIPKRKINTLMTFFGLLGAKKASITRIRNVTKNYSIDVIGNLDIGGEKIKILDSKIDYDVDYLEKMLSSMTFYREWKGRPNLEKAKSYMYEKGLNSETVCKFLYEEVFYNPDNLIKYKEEISLTKEVKRIWQLIGECEIPGIFKISSDYKRKLEQIEEYALIIEIEF